MKWLSIILALVVNVAACGGRVWEAECPYAGVACEPPHHTAYCCPADTECCERDGLYGCCQGDVPDATPY